MAQSNGRKKTSNSKKRSTGTSKSNYRKKTNHSNNVLEETIIDEIFGILAIAVTIILFLSNFHIIGKLGDALSSFMFGIFGIFAYIAPLVIFFGTCIYIANIEREKATLKLICGIISFIMLCVMATLFSGINNCGSSFKSFYQYSSMSRKGGGIIGGFLGRGLYNLLDIVGTWIVVLLLLFICIIILTEKAILSALRARGEQVAEFGKYKVERQKSISREKNAEKELLRQERRERILEEEKERQNRRTDNKVSGVSLLSDAFEKKNDENSSASDKAEASDTKEIVNKPVLSNKTEEEQAKIEKYDKEREKALSDIKIRGIDDKPKKSVDERELGKEIGSTSATVAAGSASVTAEKKDSQIKISKEEKVQAEIDFKDEVNKTEKPKVDYKIPPTNLLKLGKQKTNHNNGDELRETARRLEMVLDSFGVKAEVKDISQGPAVTRYELQPDIGVKVSRIVNLADDIKLNLAASDIRIEAPIPGKAAVGIEVPNNENSAVFLRDLFESNEYKDAKSKITFAVGKDIGGNTVVTDLAKMPHLLIAGSTGSGKSVCINTIIMSILYKAKPDEVKLMMIDPKVVELSVYNGIPHLLVPVVIDPKKAAAALRWGVTEMEERYRKFADLEVRDLAGYNAKVESMTENNGEPIPEKLPQILIIVDELADLMMVASNEVEESICRLAQLARACGIHLIIATQRPSVDVITGLIKANMPSRVAFAVSSGTDSRTILDMNGAEKLLGKGDMLFYPQGKPKPERVQGAFVSDEEVQAVVSFVKGQNIDTNYKAEISEKIESGISSSGGSGFTDSPDDRDPLFVDAAKFVMEKEKASIGYLQRVFKIGFNRAARIMDQLEEFGVVGPEQGTKPREVKMNLEQFENALENGE